MKHIGIIGAGLAGLTVAYRRAVATPAEAITVLEASPRFGGQLLTAHREGYVVDEGAEGYVARSEAVPALATSLGIADDILHQATMTSYRFDGEKLVALAPGEAAAQLDFKVAKRDFGAGIHTFAGGMGTLTDALAAAVAASPTCTVKLGTRALAVRRAGDAIDVEIDGGEVLRFDGIVIATSSVVAASLLGVDIGAPAEALATAETLSSVTVSFAYPRSAVAHALDGTGCVIATPFEGCRAITFTSSKFEGRAPQGELSLRVFFRPEGDELTAMGDADWQARAARALERVLSLHSSMAPIASWVSRWPNALPVITPQHAARVRALEEALSGSGIFLAGSAFHGSGIDAAVRSAEAAQQAIGALGARV